MDPRKALESLLLKMFSADELRRLLRYLPDGETLVLALPGGNASPVSVISALVERFDELDYLGEPALWDMLLHERPRRADEIHAVRKLCSQGGAKPKAVAAAVPTPQAQPSSAPVMTVLLVSASPDDKERSRVAVEFRRIIDKVRGSRFRDRLHLVQVQAARFEDLRTALMEHEPRVLHISARGESDGSLVFEATAEKSLVPAKNMVRLLGALGDKLQLVVLSAGYSETLARELAPILGCCIGMNQTMVGSSAIEFSAALYETLAFGKSVETAFNVALAGLDADDEVPQLFPLADQDPDHKRRQVLISGDV